MTEAQKRWAEFGYEPVGAIVNKLLGRYLRTQRKNMLRFFQERGLYSLANRMKQIRNSRQGMTAKSRMFQEVLNSYASQTMQTQTPVPEREGSVLHVRPPAYEGVELSSSGVREVSLDGMAESKPGEAAGDSSEALRIPESN